MVDLKMWARCNEAMSPIPNYSWFRLWWAALFIGFVLFDRAASGAADPWVANLTAGTNADGRLELFEVAANGALRHRWQRESLHDWSAWSSLGGSFQPGAAVANDAMGRLVVFAVNKSTQHVMYNCQRTPNSTAWTNWTALARQPVHGPLAAAADTNGCLEVFAVGAGDGSLKHIWQDHAGEDWSAWADLGGPFLPGPVVARNKSGELEVFAINANNQDLVHCWEMAPGKPDSWTPWSSLNEPISPGFAVGENLDGRLEVFGVNAQDGFVVHAYQTSAAPDADWSDWINLGAKMRPAISLGRNRDGRLEIFTVGAGRNMIFHAFQSKAGATTNWVGWTDMSLFGSSTKNRGNDPMRNRARLADIGGATRSYPVIENNTEGSLEIFAFDERLDDVVNHRREITGNLSWTDWLSLDAGASPYISHGWRMDDGLPDNRVQAITQTPDGYIWVGTHNGLAKFDGVHFVAQDVNSTFRLINSSVTCLCAGHDGALWIGSEYGGVVCSRGTEVLHLTARTGLAGDSVKTIVEAGDHSLWIGTTTGLSHYYSGMFSNYTRKEGLSSENIRSGLEDSDGNLWFTTDHGLSRVNGKTITALTRVPGDSLTGIWQDIPGRLWIGSDRGLIFSRNGSFHAYDQKYGLSDRLASVIRSDALGNLWVGNNNGLNKFREGRFFEELDQQGNSFGKINALFEDREGNLWIGSQDGLFRLTPKRLLLYGKQQQLTHNNISAVTEDDAGSLWVGTLGGGLDQLKDETVRAFAPTNGFPFDLISSICNGKDGSLWVGGTSGGGVAQLKDGTVTYRTGNDVLTDITVKVLHEDRSGNLWVGTSRGLACLSDHRFVTNLLTDGLTNTVVRAICEGPNGLLWFGTENGLARWTNGALSYFGKKDGLSDDLVTALYLDDQQALWIGTQNGGLNRFNNGRFNSYTTANGLSSDEIFEVVEDDFGWLWMTCSKGVFRVRKQNLDDFDHKSIPAVTSIAYGHDDGMESILCGSGKPGAWKTRDGELWFPTGQGLVAFDPRLLKINRTPPPVYIEDMMADKHSLLSSLSSEVRVPPGRGELEFHYTAPSFQRPERIRFKFQLVGADPEWIDADTRRVAYYNNLSPGSYRFRVIACNSDGVWNEAGASLPVVLLPHFWQTWWFRVLVISIVIGTVAATARQVTRKKMQRKMELLEQKHAIEKERLRIAQDIHDDLGGSLTQIALLGELAIGSLAQPQQAAGHLAKITNSARLNVRALDEIVWAVHPGNDTLNSLVLYLWQFAEEFFGATAVRCRVDAPASIPSRPLSSDLRHSIFLMVKEAFNNTVKHARASEVRLRFTMPGADFVIIIEDNGAGFNVAAVNGAGNGLSNMKRRTAEIGGRLVLASAPGKGTRLEFVLPMKNHHHVN